MISAIFSQPGYEAAKKMLDVTTVRHQAIASNISNAETPGYKRIDLNPSFQAELNQALQAGESARLNTLNPTISIDPTALPTTQDGNTVDLEAELLAMSQNTMEHTLETQLVSGSLNKIRMAITGRS